MSQRFKAAISAISDFISGRAGEAEIADASDQDLRQAVAKELVRTMSGEAIETTLTDTSQSNSTEEARERARQLFMEHGYFDDTVRDLRAADSSADRAAAARALGLLGSQRGTAHLIAAMFDDDPEVRSAAEQSIVQIGEPLASDVKTEVGHAEESLTAAAVLPADQVSEGEVSPKLEGQIEQVDEPTSLHELNLPAQVENEETAKLETAIEQPPREVIQEPSVTADENQLLEEEQSIRKRIAHLQQKLTVTADAQKKSENEVQWRAEREAKLRDEAAARQRQEEELRRQTDEAEARRRIEEAEAAAIEHTARIQAEAEANRLAEEEAHLRIEAANLRQVAEEQARQRMAMITARLDAAEAAAHADAQRKRAQAEAEHKAEVERLRLEEEALRAATAEAVQRRAAIEAARKQEERDAERLLAAQTRMRAAEEIRARTEAERQRAEAELHQQVEAEERRLSQIRLRAREEQARLEAEAQRLNEAELKRLADIERAREEAEIQHQERTEREREILAQIDSLRIADAEARKRIAEAEMRKHTADQAYQLTAEKVQRLEAEAHARAVAEERIIAKLESERRRVANEAQARAEQERRIREEIDLFRRLEHEERPRLEALTLQRTAAEARLQEQRGDQNAEQEARLVADERLKAVGQYQTLLGEDAETRRPPGLSMQSPLTSRSGSLSKTPGSTLAASDPSIDTDETIQMPPAIGSYLHSVDPYKRAAAVAELARSQPTDAFALIAKSFEDHSPHVRNAAARALRKLAPTRTVDLFNRALEEGSEQRRLNIGSAIAGSGLATEAIEKLASENREDTYNALSILFVMAKSGEIQPLVQAIEQHKSDEVSQAVIKLLTLSGHSAVGEEALQRRLKRTAGAPKTGA